jgi:hypothetical protein
MIRPLRDKLAGGRGASATTIAVRDESARNPRITGNAIEPRRGATSRERPIVPATRHIRVAGLSGGSSRTRHPRLLLFWRYAPPHGCDRSCRPDGVTRAKTQRLEASARGLPLCSAIPRLRSILRRFLAQRTQRYAQTYAEENLPLRASQKISASSASNQGMLPWLRLRRATCSREARSATFA